MPILIWSRCCLNKSVLTARSVFIATDDLPFTKQIRSALQAANLVPVEVVESPFLQSRRGALKPSTVAAIAGVAPRLGPQFDQVCLLIIRSDKSGAWIGLF